ncbi:hypothetical protein PENSPDRAFT_217047 [Peniophora sp. CONT]|nr:hypothetical protein PENSPDRAFT_217047 [Peniophora sp. CONT]
MPPNGVFVEDLTLDDSDEDKIHISDDEIVITKTSRSVPKSSASQKQPVASGSKPVASKVPVSDTKPIASGSRPVTSGSRPTTSVNSNASGSQSVPSGSHSSLFVPGTSMRTKHSGPGPKSSSKAQNYNKRTTSESRTDPPKRRKTIDVDDSSDGIEEITTPTPRGYNLPTSSRKGKSRTSITPQARHRSAPRTVAKPQQVAPSEPIMIDDDDDDPNDNDNAVAVAAANDDDDDEIMVIDPPPQFEYITAKAESLVTEPFDLSNIGESIDNDVSDSDNDEISDQDVNGGYTFGLYDIGIWKEELPQTKQYIYTAEAQPVDASSFRWYRSPRILLHDLDEEDEPPPDQEMDGNTDEEIFEAAVRTINREAEPPTTWMMMHRSQRGGPLGNSWRYALSAKYRLELNVKERDADKPLAASGSVISIAQAPGHVAVGSTTFRGNLNDDAPDVDQNDDGGFANSLGCLRVWDDVDRYPLAGHQSEWILGQEGHRVHRQRYYEVKEVVFDCSDPCVFISGVWAAIKADCDSIQG